MTLRISERLCSVVSIGICSLFLAAPSLDLSLVGNELGNGGDIVLCSEAEPKLEGQQALVLDLYEAYLEDMPIQVEEEDGDFERENGMDGPLLGFAASGVRLDDDQIAVLRIADRVLRRIKSIDPDRYTRYVFELQTFFDSAAIDNYHLESPDQGPVLMLPSCHIEQLAMHQKVVLPHDKRFYIAKPLWQRLDRVNKAFLVLHEIIYREARSLQPPHEHSRLVRYYNRHLANPDIEQMDPQVYSKLLDDVVDLPATRVLAGIQFRMRDLQYEGHTPVRGRVSRESQMPLKFHSIAVAEDAWVSFDDEGRATSVEQLPLPEGLTLAAGCRIGLINAKGKLSFYEDMTVANIQAELSREISVPLCTGQEPSPRLLVQSDDVSFYQNGMLRAASLGESFTTLSVDFPVACDGKVMALAGGSAIELYDNGLPKKLTVGSDHRFCIAEERWLDVAALSTIQFDALGYLIEENNHFAREGQL